MADEKSPKLDPENEERAAETSSSPVTRRQFLIGAGVGAVVGAAGVGGVLSATAHPQAVTQTQSGSAPASAAAQPQELEEKVIKLKVNGKDVEVIAKARATLSDVLRYQLGLTGVHVGCNRAECGTCTVAMDGKHVYSCSTMAFAAEGHEIVTIEGLAKNTSSLEGLHPIQRQFALLDGGQCNFCIPGQIVSAYTLLQQTKNPTQDQIRQNQSGNLCRCGNYQHITQAIAAAAKEMGG